MAIFEKLSLTPFGCLEVTSNPLDQSWQMIPLVARGGPWASTYQGSTLIQCSGNVECKQKGFLQPF